MSTLQTMRNRIANETGHYDLVDQIDPAINTAIQTYQTEPFVFTLAEFRVDTVASQEAYTLPTDLKTTSGAAITAGEDLLVIESCIHRTGAVSGVIRKADRQWLDLYFSTVGGTGIPTYFHRQGASLRFGPIPNGIFNVYFTGLKKLAPLTTGASSNAWMIEGEALIRARAKVVLARDVLRDPDLAGAAQASEQEALAELKRQYAAHTGKPQAPAAKAQQARTQAA